MSAFRFQGKLGIAKTAASSLGPDDSHLPADEPEDPTAREVTLAESPAQRGTDTPTVLVDVDWSPPAIVVGCVLTECSHNYRGFCSGVDGHVLISREPDMGTSTRSTECAYFDPLTPTHDA